MTPFALILVLGSAPATDAPPTAAAFVKPPRTAWQRVSAGAFVAMAGLFAGANGAIAVIDREEKALGYQAYVEKQRAPSLMHPVMGTLGLLTLLGAGAVMLTSGGPQDVRFWLGLVGVVGVVAITAVSLAINVPINAQTAAWTPEAMPSDWQAVRERWSQAHAGRAVITLPVLTAAVWAVLTDG